MRLSRLLDTVSRIVSRILIGLLLIGLITTGVGAVAAQQPSTELTCGSQTYDVDIRNAVSLYNANTDAVPSPIARVAGSNTTELRIEGASQPYYTLSADESLQITSLEVSQADNPDVIIKTDQETACLVATSSDPVSAFQTAYSNDEVTIEGTNTVDQAKVFVIERVLEVASLLN